MCWPLRFCRWNKWATGCCMRYGQSRQHWFFGELAQVFLGVYLQNTKFHKSGIICRTTAKKKSRRTAALFTRLWNGGSKIEPPFHFAENPTTTLHLVIWHGSNRRMPPCATKLFDIKQQEPSYQKKSVPIIRIFRPWRWTDKSCKYFYHFIYACPHFADGRFLLFMWAFVTWRSLS